MVLERLGLAILMISPRQRGDWTEKLHIIVGANFDFQTDHGSGAVELIQHEY